MNPSEVRSIVDEHFRVLREVFAGRPGDPLAMMHRDVLFHVPGPLPVSGSHDYQYLEKLFARGSPIPPREGFGHYPLEYIEDGNRLVVIARSRLTGSTGLPYNNTFFMFYEIRDGKILRFVECLDGSMFMQVNAGTHIEPQEIQPSGGTSNA